MRNAARQHMRHLPLELAFSHPIVLHPPHQHLALLVVHELGEGVPDVDLGGGFRGEVAVHVDLGEVHDEVERGVPRWRAKHEVVLPRQRPGVGRVAVGRGERREEDEGDDLAAEGEDVVG